MAYGDIHSGADILDIRSLIERLEEIESEQSGLIDEYREAKEEADEPRDGDEIEWQATERLTNAINALSSFWDLTPEEIDGAVEAIDNDADSFNGDEEAHAIRSFVEQFRGYGGDHEWEGSWFPVTFIRDEYFTEFAEEFAGDIGAIDPNANWPTNCIDWDKAARELQIDYTSGEYEGETYWAR